MRDDPDVTTAAPADLVGVWRLSVYQAWDRDGRVDHPLGPRPHGLIVYTADGHMSVHVMAADRPVYGAVLPFDCAPEEKVTIAGSYFGYAGTYAYDGEEVTHHVSVASFPNWTGTELRRAVDLDGDVLTLTGGEQLVGGRLRRVVLTWERDRGAPC